MITDTITAAIATCRILPGIELIGAKGKRADLVLFNPDRVRSMPMHDPMATIVYSSSAENIDTTIVDGKVVYRKGVFSCGIEEAQLAEQVRNELQGVTFI